jgi:2-keto-4-pentenoate hydratase/2-oxohepta-3-ene-1,7-dioic acid hydratase in catechol pathway
MKLVSFMVHSPLGPQVRVGALQDEDEVIDLALANARLLARQGASWEAAVRIAAEIIPGDMVAFLERGELGLAAARSALAIALEEPTAAEAGRFGPEGVRLVHSLRDAGTCRLLAPLPRANSLRDFLAFEAHVRKGYERRNQEFPDLWYRLPSYYKGNTRSLLGPGQPVQWPRFTERFDFELELACVIGKPGRNIPKGEAHQYIAGYMILNDWSARDIQMQEVQLRLGPAKGKDFATSIGPWLVTPDEVGDVRDLAMVARINGEEWSRGNSGDSHWTFEQMIAHVSTEETLHPGDIIGSGTCGGGCGYELDRWIRPGDQVELEISRLGRLQTVVLPPSGPFESLVRPASEVH